MIFFEIFFEIISSAEISKNIKYCGTLHYIWATALAIVISAFHICSREKHRIMAYAFNEENNGYVRRCLECGEPVPYGRHDRLYCCDSCKNRYNYGARKHNIKNRANVMRILARNYSVLRAMLRENILSLDITQMIFRGFNPDYMTCCQRRPRYSECCCFDIRYNLTQTRIFSISRM